jgi:predicted dehydrogenase
MSSFSFNRREFIKGTTFAAAALAMGGGCSKTFGFPAFIPAKPRFRKPDEKLNIGVIGVGGKGWSNWEPMFKMGENIVALCDVDRRDVEKGTNHVKGRCPGVKGYSDYRKMLAECDNLDAVLVSTPDHTHAPAAIRAMKKGCHVYVEKPLVRTIWEARYFELVAKTNGVVTQMGNQGSASNGLRRSVEILHAGVLGNVKEVHVWTNRPIWPQGITRPAGSDPVPDFLDWDAWLGTAPERPFKNDVYHKFKWRGFFDYGTGAFGDMACHTMNLPFRGLKLGKVTGATCIKIEGQNPDTYPNKSIVKMTYAARGQMPAVDLFWYDGNLKPSAEIMPQVIATLGQVPNTGCLIIGDKGMLVSTNDYGEESYIGFKGEQRMKSTLKSEAFKDIPVSLPRCNRGHHGEFVDACKGIGSCFSDIHHSVPMLESMLVGCIAQQVPGNNLLWSSELMTFNHPAANALVKPFIRPGWEF